MVRSGLTIRTKAVIRRGCPLWLRKLIAIGLYRQPWISQTRRTWWVIELLRDFAAEDVTAYHKFLWTHHLAYASPYEVATRFGDDNLIPSRRLFFTDVCQQLQKMGGGTAVRSVLEVGCSLGYNLRYMETELFPSATVLDGVDLDCYAIQSGQEYLRAVKSHISLHCGDMQQLEDLLGDRCYDVIICCGVLMYIREVEAAAVVRTMLAHSRILVALTGLAHPSVDNERLDHSEVRHCDQTFIHNLDRMVETAGGMVMARRWEGVRQVDGQTIYFAFAAPPLLISEPTASVRGGAKEELQATKPSYR